MRGVLGEEHLGEELLLEVEAAVEGDVEAPVDGALGEALRLGGARRQRGGPLEGAVEHRLGRDDLVDEPDAPAPRRPAPGGR